MDLTLDSCRRTFTAALHPFLYLSETCIKSYRKRILAGNLETVVLGRIVRCGNLYRSLEPVMSCTEIQLITFS